MNYSRKDYDYLLFVRYLLGTAYLPPPIDRIAFKFFSALVPKPTLTVFIDVKPETALKRIAVRPHNTPEIFEIIESLREIRRKGLMIGLFAEWQIINGNRSVHEIELEIRKLLNNI
jgi:thymidylate kinase